MHGDLVGGVQDAGRRAPLPRRLAGQAQAGKCVEVDRLEGELAHSCEVERNDGAGTLGESHAVPSVQRIGDRDAHAGRTEMGEHGAVSELHETVDDRLRMHDDVDALVGRAEEVVGLHDLEALVHQGRRVDRDLAAHRPGRVGERLLDGHVLELLASAPPERPPAGGDRQPLDRPRRLSGEELVKCRVLRVDRHDLRPRGLGKRRHQLTSDDQRLLVGERQIDPLAEGRDGGAEPRGADERVQYEIRLGLDHEPHETLGAREHLAVRPRLPRSRGGVLVGQGDAPDPVQACLLEQRLPRALG